MNYYEAADSSGWAELRNERRPPANPTSAYAVGVAEPAAPLEAVMSFVGAGRCRACGHLNGSNSSHAKACRLNGRE